MPFNHLGTVNIDWIEKLLGKSNKYQRNVSGVMWPAFHLMFEAPTIRSYSEEGDWYVEGNYSFLATTFPTGFHHMIKVDPGGVILMMAEFPGVSYGVLS